MNKSLKKRKSSPAIVEPIVRLNTVSEGSKKSLEGRVPSGQCWLLQGHRDTFTDSVANRAGGGYLASSLTKQGLGRIEEKSKLFCLRACGQRGIIRMSEEGTRL